MPTSVALGSYFEEFVRKLLSSGRFNNASEVVRAGLRLLEDEEKLHEIRRQELKVAIREGLDSEDAGSLEDIIAQHRSRRSARKTTR
jgi:antitoxin ParD1/3/4